ncbi:MAG: hypothetical protein GY737_00385 [Desulfobacteraceae bacterium]|nr:hypothetical protein [Desulfobacteraceae bacterium]
MGGKPVELEWRTTTYNRRRFFEIADELLNLTEGSDRYESLLEECFDMGYPREAEAEGAFVHITCTDFAVYR